MTDQRATYACAECRTKKIRCIPDPEDEEERCRRCAKLGLNCLVPEKKPRAKKSRLRGRVDQLENNYAQILSLLNTQNGKGAPQSYHPSSDTSMEGLPTPADSVLSAGTSLSLRPTELSDADLNTYRRMSGSSFPYVLILDHVSAASLCQRRPMLGQAIGIVASWEDENQQSARQARFLADLSERYFFRCERSLDLLQALLVYFGWCHWYATPYAQNAYRLASLAVNMALDLGINEKPSSLTQHQMILQSNLIPRETSEAISDDVWSHEVRRAYAGAYALSTYTSFLFRKPSALTYNKHLHKCIASLRADPQFPSDTQLIHFITQKHIAEQITRSFDQGSSEMMQKMDDGKIQVILKALVGQLNEWKSSLPPDALKDARLMRHEMLTRAYCHEIGLYNLLQGGTPSVTRIELILECFNLAKEYLTQIMAMTLKEMADWTNLDWKVLNYAVMITSRGATILDSFCYSSESAQRAAWIEDCFDTICTRARMLRRMTRSGANHYFDVIASEWTNAKLFYQQGVRQAFANSTTLASASQPMPTQPLGEFNPDDLYNMSWSSFGIDANLAAGFDNPVVPS